MPGIDHGAIRLALRARLLTVSGIPTAHAWENRMFIPPNPPAPWLRETLLPATDRLVATNTRQAAGIMQYDLFHPVAESTEVPDALAKSVADVFNQNFAISPTIWVTHAERGRGESEDVFYRVPVYVNWLAFADNV